MTWEPSGFFAIPFIVLVALTVGATQLGMDALNVNGGNATAFARVLDAVGAVGCLLLLLVVVTIVVRYIFRPVTRDGD